MAFAQVEKISPAEAARIFGPLCHLDPSGEATAQSVAEGGQAMRLQCEAGDLVMVLDRRGDDLWIEAATGSGTGDLTRAGLDFAEHTGRLLQCDRVAFQTKRRGLMRKARRLGYSVNGFQVSKGIK